MKRIIPTLFLLLFWCATAVPDDEPKTIAAKTEAMDVAAGFFTYYWDKTAGKVWLEIEKFDEEFLYVTYVSRGLGSNDVGLDRGQISDSYIVYLRRVGPKVLMMQKNYDYRAPDGDAAAIAAVDEAFAVSTLWGFEVEAEENGRVLVDATDFLLRDARDVIGSMRRSRQGSFKLESSRSAIDLEGCGSFPLNTEFESILTFTTDSAGSYVQSVTPTSNAVTIQIHHSLVQLPDDGYSARTWDPRCGYFGGEYMDYSAPITEPITKRFIARHRLEKKDPTAAMSEPVEPLIYYVDRGAPEPMRSALIEGAQWWNQAFEAAGFIDAFRVELMPEDASPMDLRYNTIQWVHRSTRGWSYGSSVSDPRTGEILKGHITLGSLRARQDYLIAEGLLQPYDGTMDSTNPMTEMALARLRQLSCHEVGHTLGLRHNYIASTQNRASVMDYAYPYVQLDSAGNIDLSEAYAVDMGAWDKAAIVYGYSQFPEGADEDSALGSVLDSVYASGLLYVTDGDARSWSSSHPYAHLWDNGADAADELVRLLKVRAKLLNDFSEKAIPEGTPMQMLEETLVPIYLFHRYQIEACAKILGGVDYGLALRGAGPQTSTPVSAENQWRALKALLMCIEPEVLVISDTLLKLLPPQTTGIPRSREIFERRTGSNFDPLTAAENVADMVVRMILQSDRAARLVEHNSRLGLKPSLAEVIDRLFDVTWKAYREPGFGAEIQRVVDNVVMDRLIRLAANKGASAQVRAIARLKLDLLNAWIGDELKLSPDVSQTAHLSQAGALISRYLDDPEEFDFYEQLDPPAGSPIGEFSHYGCDY
jgi:hypothetical protein